MPENKNNIPEAADIANRIHAGDRQAERDLLARYLQPMLALLRYRCHDPEVAADLCQETFRIVIEQLRKQPLDNPSSLGGYIRRIAMNLFVTELRRQEQQRTSPDMEVIEQQIAEQVSAYDDLQREQSRRAVKTLLKTLKVERDRQILRMYYLAELDKETICERLELSPAHFDRVLYRARQRLRAEFERLERGPDRHDS